MYGGFKVRKQKIPIHFWCLIGLTVQKDHKKAIRFKVKKVMGMQDLGFMLGEARWGLTGRVGWHGL